MKHKDTKKIQNLALIERTLKEKGMNDMSGVATKKRIHDEESPRRLSGDELNKLISRAISDDRDALARLCELIAKSVLFRLSYMIGNESDAEDLAQEVMIRMCKGITKLREPRAFGSWLSSIIANEANRYLTNPANALSTADIENYADTLIEEKEEALPHDSAHKTDVRETMLGLMSNLSEQQRVAVSLHYYDNLNVTDTAKAMGVTRQSVSSYLAMAHKKLKVEIESLNVGGLAALLASAPIGAIMHDTLHMGELMFTPNVETLNRIATCGTAALLAAGGVAATAGSSVAKTTSVIDKLGIAATIVAACALVFAMIYYATQSEPEQIPLATDAIVSAYVAFDGPIEGAEIENVTDSAHTHVNPTSAIPVVEVLNTEITPLSWAITRYGSDLVLHQGDGENVEGVFEEMFADEDIGKFQLFFYLQTTEGSNFRLKTHFYIAK